MPMPCQETKWLPQIWDLIKIPWQKPNEKNQSTKHVGHPAYPFFRKTSILMTPTSPSSATSVLVDLGVTSLTPDGAFTTFTLILLIPYPHRKEIVTFLPSLTVILMETATPPSSTSALLSEWIARFGMHEQSTPYRGTTFTSQLWTQLANLKAIPIHQRTAYNPATNSNIERYHHTHKATLMSHCNDSNWFTLLPCILLGLRVTPKDAQDVSAAEMVYGNPFFIPAIFFFVFNLLRQSPAPTSHCGKIHSMPLDFQTPRKATHPDRATPGKIHIFLCSETSKPPLTPPYMGPFLVIHRTLKAFLLNMRGKEDRVSIDHLKFS
ncbi:uncharacterized protein [Palaemon carinicauda]|uniref:uncharacterized protein n=1 Tax=Palaemon carinicauda TaxID=392227 RepID=UPI0035B66B5C